MAVPAPQGFPTSFGVVVTVPALGLGRSGGPGVGRRWRGGPGRRLARGQRTELLLRV